MKIILGRQGFIKGILSLLILVALVAVGLAFAKPYYRYYTLGSHTRDLLKTEIGNLETIKDKILQNAKELNIPLNQGAVEVTLLQKVVKVNARWSETVDLWGYYQRKIDFEMKEEY